MQGLEVALIRLATTVLGTVARSLVAPKPGAGLVPDPVRPLPRPAKPGRLAAVLGGRLAKSYAGLPENERLAAVDAVRDTFAAQGTLSADRLFSLDLAPERLAAELSAPPPGLSERAAGLYRELLERCCAHVVEQLTAEPSFAARAAVEQVRAAERTRELVADVRDRVGPHPGAAALDFEERYAAFVAAAHSRMGLFGLTLGRSAGEWPLETAYISLAVSSRLDAPDWWEGSAPDRVTVKAEQALAETSRLLLRGPAGSGKSTLVQWLAVNAARQSFDSDLADWNRCVPFVLRLRAFTSDDRLPGPEDFLRATGVPLHGAAPAGWADRLLSEGRGLVLVDGVDEVPMRLRRRTEKWLKDLITAYPRSRYVVTTRPSAVPDGWLGQQGFVAHSMLPMDRDDIRAFIRHWHDAARGQCPAPEERGQLDVYEASLRRAVGLRRDLGRLATNPLMCALLCALNRDRRMQLPRARKELYDAALDMLLVRRDTEREIVNVEGVDLTREEQTALLQRLAYWLIRNGQLEAAREEAVTMVAEWLRAMPQVRGTATQVFSHLLIRSGLLREPAPGAVAFVHRTFLDYLGAKAAVEARDFGVLVRNAHDDGWDDVVQMAVGHARVDERTLLLSRLLHRSEEEPEHRHRLVLLAAASLDHAPELSPGVRSEVQTRTEKLLPPLAPEDADELAKAGELVLDLLPKPGHLSAGTAAAIVRTAGLIGGDAAFEVMVGFRQDERPEVSRQLTESWGAFPAEAYAREVLSAGSWATSYLYVRRADQLGALRHVRGARRIHVSGAHRDLGPLLRLDAPEALFLYDNWVLTDLSALASVPSLTEVGISLCPEVKDLRPLATPALRSLMLYEINADVSLEPLRDMTGLTAFTAQHPVLVESVGELPIGPQLTNLALSRQTRYLRLDGIERWPRLDALTVGGRTQLGELERHPSLATLTTLGVHEVDHFDPRMIHGLTALRRLLLFRCGTVADLAPLRELPGLTSLRLSHCALDGPPVDLSPLAAFEGLTVTLSGDTKASGTELFPPGRIIHRP
ncbi:NACHT domain-containing protein [Streptomyces sp. ITFR-16]|uniref:NACHT domain-containing protein n=1 Tax=Streptomyces sp. ITFR-16 TaxID=3075198 RepID=UPI00288C6021|nr:NACHT domain-containing protein [Streptomyces sp. ITFR-16]WNI25529.1 NACHT domain-containing protein [Streptomyces sp. ITFR-16]